MQQCAWGALRPSALASGRRVAAVSHNGANNPKAQCAGYAAPSGSANRGAADALPARPVLDSPLGACSSVPFLSVFEAVVEPCRCGEVPGCPASVMLTDFGAQTCVSAD